MLLLYNTLSKQKEKFVPLRAPAVGIYVCGMTVYDHCHIGHARVWIVFDVLVRYLKTLGLNPYYVRNITDIDDKIIQRAKANNESITSLTARMVQSMHEDMQALKLNEPNVEPYATHYVDKMIALIQQLIEKGYAYQGESGDIYYSVKQFQRYGMLSSQSLQALVTGARVAPDTAKRDPLDFVLWKKTPDADMIGWDSPWGRGRPGWHIECSTMALAHLSDTVDIHGGGVDLQFPHHENEIAQSEAVTNKTFANTWMHVGFVQVKQEKMSKSKGNALFLKDILSRYSGETIRYFLLTSHYRSPITYLADHIKAAQKSLEHLYHSMQYVDKNLNRIATGVIKKFEETFYHALDDDLNTPVALSVLFSIHRAINRANTLSEKTELANLLKKLGHVLGILQGSLGDVLLKKDDVALDTVWIENEIQRRNEARAQRNWQLADDIRKHLLHKGIVLEDSTQGTQWKQS